MNLSHQDQVFSRPTAYHYHFCTLLRSPSPCLLPTRTRCPQHQAPLSRLFLPAAAASKGFGELLSQQNEDDEAGTSRAAATSLTPRKGFGEPPAARKQQHKSNKFAADEEDVDGKQTSAVCPCGGGDSRLSYTECCFPFHDGKAVEPDGLSVLKARFSAYARGLIGYVVETTHPENPDWGDDLAAAVHATCERLNFYKLDIINYESVNDHESYVTFRVIYGTKNGAVGDRKVLEEKSHFVRKDGVWLFMNGEALNQASQAEWMLSASQGVTEDARVKRPTKPKLQPKLRPRKI